MPHPHADAEATIVGCAVLVGAVWGFRTLYEAGREVKEERSTDLKELAGFSAHPAHPAQFLVGYGFLFFTLSIVAMGAPELAKNFGILVAVGTTLTNGAMIFTDIGNATAGAAALESGPTTQLVSPGKALMTGESQIVRSKT